MNATDQTDVLAELEAKARWLDAGEHTLADVADVLADLLAHLRTKGDETEKSLRERLALALERETKWQAECLAMQRAHDNAHARLTGESASLRRELDAVKVERDQAQAQVAVLEARVAGESDETTTALEGIVGLLCAAGTTSVAPVEGVAELVKERDAARALLRDESERRRSAEREREDARLWSRWCDEATTRYQTRATEGEAIANDAMRIGREHILSLEDASEHSFREASDMVLYLGSRAADAEAIASLAMSTGLAECERLRNTVRYAQHCRDGLENDRDALEARVAELEEERDELRGANVVLCDVRTALGCPVTESVTSFAKKTAVRVSDLEKQLTASESGLLGMRDACADLHKHLAAAQPAPSVGVPPEVTVIYEEGLAEWRIDLGGLGVFWTGNPADTRTFSSKLRDALGKLWPRTAPSGTEAQLATIAELQSSNDHLRTLSEQLDSALVHRDHAAERRTTEIRHLQKALERSRKCRRELHAAKKRIYELETATDVLPRSAVGVCIPEPLPSPPPLKVGDRVRWAGATGTLVGSTSDGWFSFKGDTMYGTVGLLPHDLTRIDDPAPVAPPELPAGLVEVRGNGNWFDLYVAGQYVTGGVSRMFVDELASEWRAALAKYMPAPDATTQAMVDAAEEWVEWVGEVGYPEASLADNAKALVDAVRAHLVAQQSKETK